MTHHYEIRNEGEWFPWSGDITFATIGEAVDYLSSVIEPGTWTIYRVENALVARREVEDNEEWQAECAALREQFKERFGGIDE